MNERVNEMDPSTIFWMIVLGYVVFKVIVYALALSRSKRGLMITYRSWTDLCVSSLWIPLVPIGLLLSGYELGEFGPKITMWRVFGCGTLAAGLGSFLWLLFFAVKNNWFHPLNIYLALNTRAMASFIVVLAALHVFALFNQSKREKRVTLVESLTSALFTGAIFVWLIRPLVCDRNDGSREV